MATISAALQMYDQVGKMQGNMSMAVVSAANIASQMQSIAVIMSNVLEQQQKWNKAMLEGKKQVDNLWGTIQDWRDNPLKIAVQFGIAGFQTALQTTKEETKLATLLNQNMGMGSQQIHDFTGKLRDMEKTGSMSYGSLVAEAGVLAASMNDAEALITALSAKSILPETPEGKIQAFNESLQKVQQTVGEKLVPMVVYALDSFTPLIDKLNEWLQSDSAQMFFSLLGMGLTLAVDGFVWLIETISALWPVIEPVLAMVTGALTLWATTQIPLLIAKLGTMIGSVFAMVAPILLQAAAWVLLNWQILLIGAAIGLVLYGMLTFGDQVVSMIGAVAGAISAFVAFIWNAFIGVVNSLIQLLWTGLLEPWIGIVEWVFNAFSGGFDSFGDGVANLLGQIISWFLSLGKVVTKIIDAIFGTDWTSGLTSLQDSFVGWGKNENARTTVRNPYAFSRVDYGDAFNAGKGVGEAVGQFAVNNAQGAFDKFGGMIDQFGGFGDISGVPDDLIGGSKTSFGSLPEQPFGETHIDSVGEVGKINEQVQVSNEDLTIMRELAEIKNIQNFVSLQPTVSVQTGDINNGYDVDTVVERITRRLEEDIASSAQGVYGNG